MYYHFFAEPIIKEWVELWSIVPIEQGGFKEGHSTIDHCFALWAVAQKSMELQGKLYCCFVDFRAAFDLVDRECLWETMRNYEVPPDLLMVIQELHSHNWAQVIKDTSGGLTPEIAINNGLRQGCVLAPLLFAIFLGDLPIPLSSARGASPKVNGRHLSCLLYADDLVILDQTEVGLQRKLNIFSAYCTAKRLTVNMDKTNILCFGKRNTKCNWYLGQTKLDIVNKYKHLGIWFTNSMKWDMHLEAQKIKAQLAVGGLKRFNHSMVICPINLY